MDKKMRKEKVLLNSAWMHKKRIEKMGSNVAVVVNKCAGRRKVYRNARFFRNGIIPASLSSSSSPPSACSTSSIK
jgi:hypothetical protein